MPRHSPWSLSASVAVLMGVVALLTGGVSGCGIGRTPTPGFIPMGVEIQTDDPHRLEVEQLADLPSVGPATDMVEISPEVARRFGHAGGCEPCVVVVGSRGAAVVAVEAGRARVVHGVSFDDPAPEGDQRGNYGLKHLDGDGMPEAFQRQQPQGQSIDIRSVTTGKSLIGGPLWFKRLDAVVAVADAAGKGRVYAFQYMPQRVFEIGLDGERIDRGDWGRVNEFVVLPVRIEGWPGELVMLGLQQRPPMLVLRDAGGKVVFEHSFAQEFPRSHWVQGISGTSTQSGELAFRVGLTVNSADTVDTRYALSRVDGAFRVRHVATGNAADRWTWIRQSGKPIAGPTPGSAFRLVGYRMIGPGSGAQLGDPYWLELATPDGRLLRRQYVDGDAFSRRAYWARGALVPAVAGAAGEGGVARSALLAWGARLFRVRVVAGAPSNE